MEYFVAAALEIYVNGERVLNVCRVAPYVPCTLDTMSLVPIPDGALAGGNFLIALRVPISISDWKSPGPGLYATNLTLGPRDIQWEHVWLAAIGQHATDWLRGLAQLVMGIGAFLLFRTQPHRREYLWLFLLMACEVPNIIFGLISVIHPMPLVWWRVCELISVPYIYFFVRMFCAFFGHHAGKKLQAAAILAALAFAYFYVGDRFSPRNYLLDWLADTPFFLLCGVVLPVLLIPHVRRGKYLEGILLIPLALANVEFLVSWLVHGAQLVPAWQSRAVQFYNSILAPRAGPFVVDTDAVIHILVLGTLALIILIRSNRITRNQAVIDSELANASESQRVILPGFAESIPGFKIESVYQPARELGGDFFQILPTKGDGILFVIGDVAGKGLPAALLVSILVGIIRTLADETLRPEDFLFRLNNILAGRTRGGFSTALVADIAHDGSVTLANAGHVPPFLDGREMNLEGALPLGVIAGVAYESTRFHLAPGSRLTFCTDGVCEAQDKRGKLFGFERAREISTHSAEDIALAARTHGQQDDITVVTIERLA